MSTELHPCWLPPAAPAPGPVTVVADEDLVGATLRAEVPSRPEGGHPLWLVQVHRLDEAVLPAGAAEQVTDAARREPPGDEGFTVVGTDAGQVVAAESTPGLLYGWYAARRALAAGSRLDPGTHAPAFTLRVLNHWDNLSPHPVMGQVERGYAGGSLFFEDGRVRPDLARVEQYARLLASVGVNRVSPNNVNVHPDAVRLMTDQLPDLGRVAAVLRRFGIRTLLSVSFAAPVVLGELDTADPADPAVRRWWREATDRIVEVVPGFGGYVVKADSEGQPGPFSYGRDHADGANLLAEAVAPHAAHVFWRAFVYNHRQDWRDRSTDRARAAHDHFTPLDGRFRPEVVLQVKHGPMDFQVREPVSPLLTAMPGTRLGVELQVTQEYTGQQRHVCYLATPWQEVLGTQLTGPQGPTVAETVQRSAAGDGALVGVSNVGTDPFWTGHPLAQANLYAFGRLAWDPALGAATVAAEWAAQTFPEAERPVRAEVVDLLAGSWRTYEKYTAPLGVGWMVRPGHHYGPDVDGYEYTPWGTYHFADRDGVGVDRTAATGTGFTGQYPPATRAVYEDVNRCPDELLLFFHHVLYGHGLHSGKTVIQHIYDSHFEGLEEVESMARRWAALQGRIDARTHRRVADLLREQRCSAEEWRDQVNTYFRRKSGAPDVHGRPIW